MTALVYLYLTERIQIDKERNGLQLQIDNYHHQYDILRDASHTILEKQYNLAEHFTAMRALAGDNKS